MPVVDFRICRFRLDDCMALVSLVNQNVAASRKFKTYLGCRLGQPDRRASAVQFCITIERETLSASFRPTSLNGRHNVLRVVVQRYSSPSPYSGVRIYNNWVGVEGRQICH